MNNIVREVLNPILKQNKIFINPKFKKVKLDIGLSMNAPNSELWLRNEEDLMVLGFEPSSNCFNSLTLDSEDTRAKYPQYVYMNSERIGVSFFPIKCAISSGEPRYQKFYNTAANENDKNLFGCSSLYTPTYFPVHYTEEVPVLSLKHVFDLFPWDQIPYIDQLKADTQGSDFDVLVGAGDYLNNIVYVTIENSTQGQYVKEDDYHKFDSYLKKYNFHKIQEEGINSTYVNHTHLDKLQAINFFVENL